MSKHVAPIRCATHKNYNGVERPTVRCYHCWYVWELLRDLKRGVIELVPHGS